MIEYFSKGIHNHIALQAEATPNAIAVITDGKRLTYRELNQQANQLAHYLHALGVQPETLVGIYMSRSVDMIIGILGILKVGGAYVPLDPAYPKERLALILEETQAKVLVTQEHLAKDLPTSNAQIVNLDTAWDAIASNSTGNLSCEMSAETLAYVMYTSGSTGKPKGVQITHANIHHYIQALGGELQIQPGDVYLHTASFSFSSSVRQLIVPISLGATVVLATVDQLSDPLQLFQFIKIQHVTIVDFVPSYWRRCTEILRNLEDERRRNLLDNRLRLALSASEPLLSDIPRIWQVELKPEIRFVNMYGQTETSGIIATYSIPQTNEDEVKVVPIGKSISNTQIFLMNDELVPVTDGETGEIYIGGLTLGKGYLNRPDLTKERFTNDPFSSALNTRLYKTGDLGRRLPNGAIAFAGRLDYQVKIRGKRVELGEIETSLALHPNVKQIVVVGNEAPSGDIRLIAYIVPEPSLAEVNQVEFMRELRGYLQQRLPDYMVPSFFVRLGAFPLTPNGKIDRKALPALEQIEQKTAEQVSPQSEIELHLVEIWQQVLGVRQVGIQDNFFELGGHSLIAIQLFNRIEKQFEIQLPLATILQFPTIEELAAIISRKESVSSSLLVPIQPKGSNSPLFCVHPIGGNTLEYVNLAKYLSNDQPVYGLQAEGLDGKEAFLHQVEDMAELYIKEIRAFQPNGPYLLIGYSFGGLVAFEMAQQLHAQGQKAALLALLDIASPNIPETRSSLLQFVQGHLSNLYRLNYKRRLKYLKDWLQWQLSQGDYKSFVLNQTSEELDPKYFDVVDANWQAGKKYVAQVYSGEAILFRCQVQPVKFTHYSDLGWSKLITGGLTVHEMQIGHYDVLREPYVQVVAEKLQHCLDKIQVSKGF